ncbi:hypothetical protein CRP01_39645 [Flavilitoribacter nigricans DSM 23189 = NBRC 102662]|uniref:Tetratricopeptide repeat protein n=2 Tax=Flavilitoribacter TaxID=2762562 RepID=A0A2D0MXB1_FLAN2|nr:hypothetical protein CRP01_39645 [Flavilitoribacter nigricans DSM 23189 = NBRC 102662]
MLASSGSNTIEVFLFLEIKKLKKLYEKTGDPYPVYLAGLSIAQAIELIPKASNSFQYSRLQSLLAQMLLDQGKDQYTLTLALEHICKAVEIISSLNMVSEELIKEHVKFALFLGVIKKALGEYDESIMLMRENALLLTSKKGATKLDLIPLERQEIIMHQSVKGHQKLINEASLYVKNKPIEYYSTIKRIFEFLMNTDQYPKAKELFSEYRRAFSYISRRLPPLSHISFLKNTGQFYSGIGENKKAKVILINILNEARKRNLFGQERQILYMLEEIEAGERAELITFFVKKN